MDEDLGGSESGSEEDEDDYSSTGDGGDGEDVDNLDYDSDEEEAQKETAAQKRLRLAKGYLESLKASQGELVRQPLNPRGGSLVAAGQSRRAWSDLESCIHPPRSSMCCLSTHYNNLFLDTTVFYIINSPRSLPCLAQLFPVACLFSNLLLLDGSRL